MSKRWAVVRTPGQRLKPILGRYTGEQKDNRTTAVNLA